MKRLGIVLLSVLLTIMITPIFARAVGEIQLFTLRIEFEWDKAEILPQFYEQLDRVVNVLKENPNTLARIEGHADRTPRESKAYNQRLSESRAKAVMEYMVNAGIEKGRLTAIGYGFSKPIAPNDTPENRKRNRRIEVYIEKAAIDEKGKVTEEILPVQKKAIEKIKKAEEGEPQLTMEPVKEEGPDIDSLLSRIDELEMKLKESEVELKSKRGYEEITEVQGLWKDIGKLEEQVSVLEEERGISKKGTNIANFYAGLGISFVWENFDYGYTSFLDGPYGFEPEYHDVMAYAVIDIWFMDVNNLLELFKINANVGYEFNDSLSVEVCFDYISGFLWEGKTIGYLNEFYLIEDASLRPEAKVNITTIMAAAKYYPFTISDYIHPFLVGGAGLMLGEIEKIWYGPITFDVFLLGSELEGLLGLGGPILQFRGFDSMKGPCVKFGAGTDLYINDYWSIGAELSYFIGMGDMEQIKYVKATCGITYHFK
ncbi:MAG: OmpA family protein [Thermodesulfobacteriota bacterium]|nr:OmpA family protein [Thermodesulfobacteriota bacterium]